MGDDGDEDTGVTLIMIMMAGIMITVMELMINVMRVSWLPVLSVLLMIHPSNFYTGLSRAGSQEGWSLSQHALGERGEVYHRVSTCRIVMHSH